MVDGNGSIQAGVANLKGPYRSRKKLWFLGIFIAASVIGISIFFVDKILHVAQFPDAKLVADSGVTSVPYACGRINGIYLFRSSEYITEKSVTEVEQWYRKRGWQDFRGFNDLVMNRGVDLYIFHFGIMHDIYYSSSGRKTSIRGNVQVFICPLILPVADMN